MPTISDILIKDEGHEQTVIAEKPKQESDEVMEEV